MKLIIIPFLFTLVFLTTGCNMENRKTFTISVEYSSPWGYPAKYSLTQNSIIVTGNKKGSNGKSGELYKRLLTKVESDSIYHFLKSLPYDTLKMSYQNPGFFDGTDVILKISGEGLKSKRVLVYMTSTPVTDTLEILLQNQVLDSRYRYENLYRDKNK